MSELLSDITDQARRIVDAPDADIYHEITREAVFTIDGYDIEVTQDKALEPEDIQRLKTIGSRALASTEWFNAVMFMQRPGDELSRHDSSPPMLRLRAIYPIDFFDERPVSGTFIGEDWREEYGIISSYRLNGQAKNWAYDFVAPGEREVTRLSYPSDPDALQMYNVRYQQYLDDLNKADPTIRHYKLSSRETWKKQSEAHNGLYLHSVALHETVHTGSANTENNPYIVSMSLDSRHTFQQDDDAYINRELLINADGEAVVDDIWSYDDTPLTADEELLETALALLKEVDS